MAGSIGARPPLFRTESQKTKSRRGRKLFRENNVGATFRELELKTARKRNIVPVLFHPPFHYILDFIRAYA